MVGGAPSGSSASSASAAGVGGAASAPSAPSIDAGADLGGAARISGTAGGASALHVDATMAAPTTSALTGGAATATHVPNIDAATSVGSSGEARVESAMHDHDVAQRGQHALDGEQLSERHATSAARDATIGASGYRDPTTDVGHAHQLEVEQRARAMGRVDQATDASARAEVAIDHPTGAATSAARTAGMEEAERRAPGAAHVKADVDVAAETIEHPASAGEARVEVAVDGEVRGVDPTRKK
jgi:hypothetical protein